MNTGLKITIGLGLLAGIGYAIYKAGKHVTESISYRIIGFDPPKISNQVVTVPTKVEFTNASVIPVPIQSILIQLSYKQGANYIKAGTIAQQNITIEPGTKPVTFYPTIDLKALFRNFLQTADTILSSGKVDIKADITVTVTGITVTETVFHQIPIQ